MNIFISSPIKGLTDERRAAIDCIKRLGRPIAMEQFFSSHDQPFDVCEKKIRTCDCVVLLVGPYLGSTHPTQKISITEMEYNIASALKLPVFVFIKTDSGGKWCSYETDPALRTSHENFKRRLDKERTRTCFSSPDILTAEIIGAINEYEHEYGSLGAEIPVFIKHKDYFKPYTDKNKYFHHLHTPVGIADILTKLHNFTDSTAPIAILQGRGGLGKSKLLYEFSSHFNETHPDKTLVFLKDDIPLSARSTTQLPAKPTLIVVDDAHNRSDIDLLLAILTEHIDRIKVMISCRPQGVDLIRSHISRANFNPSDVIDIGGVSALTRAQLHELACCELRDEYKHHADRLVAVACDSPLVLVTGVRLLNDHEIDPAILERDPHFHWVVLNRFSDIISGSQPNTVPRDLCRRLLSLIAILSPIRPQKHDFQIASASYLKTDLTTINETISKLEDYGILTRKGRTLQITPNVLSDHILHNACITSQHTLTGYATDVYNSFSNIEQENVLKNLSELDRRLEINGTPLNVMGEIWSTIKHKYCHGSHNERHQINSWLKDVAYYKPAEALELVEYAIRYPAKRNISQRWAHFYNITHTHVIKQLPVILSHIGYDPRYLPRCLDLLWELGRDDKRDTNSESEHAIRILCDITSYGPNKPQDIQRTVLEHVARWLADSDIHKRVHTPIPILKEILEREGHKTQLIGHGLSFVPFLVNYENTKDIRRLAVNMLKSCASSSHPKVALQALDCLFGSLYGPRGMLGQTVPDDQFVRWDEEKLQILDAIKEILSLRQEPIIQNSIYIQLSRLSTGSSSDDIEKRATHILSSVPRTFENRFLHALRCDYPREYDSGSYEEDQRALIEEIRSAAEELIRCSRDAETICNSCERAIAEIFNANLNLNADCFFRQLCTVDTALGKALCYQIIRRKKSELAPYVYSLLIPLLNSECFIAICKAALRQNNASLSMSIADSLACAGRQRSLNNQEIGLIKNLTKSRNDLLKARAIKSVGSLGIHRPKEAIALTLSCNIGMSVSLADELCSIFDKQHLIDPDLLSVDDIAQLLKKLAITTTIDEHHYDLVKFLEYVSKRAPQLVIDLFKSRITRRSRIKHRHQYCAPLTLSDVRYMYSRFRSLSGCQEYSRYLCDIAKRVLHTIIGWLIKPLGLCGRYNSAFWDYRALPLSHYRNLFRHYRSLPNYIDILRDIRNMAIIYKEPDSISALFNDVSCGMCDEARNVVLEWVCDNNENHLRTAVSLLREAHAGIVLAHPDFVDTILTNALKYGSDCYESAQSVLSCCAIHQLKHGTPGKPMPQDEAMRDQAATNADRFSPGSPTYRFYVSLMKHAEGEIRDSLARDEELFAE